MNISCFLAMFWFVGRHGEEIYSLVLLCSVLKYGGGMGWGDLFFSFIAFCFKKQTKCTVFTRYFWTYDYLAVSGRRAIVNWCAYSCIVIPILRYILWNAVIALWKESSAFWQNQMMYMYKLSVKMLQLKKILCTMTIDKKDPNHFFFLIQSSKFTEF